MRSRRELCMERAEAEKPPGRTRVSHGMGALGRGCDVCMWRWKHTVVSTFNSRGYSEDVAVIVVARGGYVTAE